MRGTVQIVGAKPFEVLQPIVEKLLQKDDKNKQRGAAEFIAGIIGGTPHLVLRYLPFLPVNWISGSKHWPADDQVKFWSWLQPHLKKILDQKSNDTLPVWGSFLEVTFFRHRDGRSYH